MGAVGACCTLAAAMACGGPANDVSVVPAASVSDAARLAAAYFVVTVPSKPSSSVHAHYVSPATESISMAVSTLSGKTILRKNADLTSKSPGCTSVSAGTRCSISGISLAAGSYSANFTAYSRTKERGQILSVRNGIPFTLKAGGTRKISFIMDGVPASFEVVPASAAVSGSPAKGFTIGAGGVWGGPQAFLMSPLDADGDAIIGAGAPQLSVTSSNSSFTVAEPVAPQQTFSITPPANVQSAATQLTLRASYPDKSVCSQHGASCVQNVSLAFAPFATDDWITFAHDFQRTGSETQATGITAATVSSLTQRWRINLLDNIYSSPVVYNGNVIVATYGGVVYDLSAADGSVIWKRTISSNQYENTRSSPMVDVADGLVFMGTWFANNDNEEQPQPSHFFALHLSNGSVAWSKVLPGMVHDAPVYANGVVYEGWSGGDLACINGGVDAFDPTTGAVKWTWLTNPVHNPGGGGGVWGAIAWDGSHIVFGTGNTCQGEAWDQGAVALNTNGSMAWHFQADPTYTDDNDTGGGISIANGIDTFINKNGSVYRLDGANGQEIGSSLPLGGVNGGHATPTTDGATYVVGAGFFTASSAVKRVSREALDRPGATKGGYISYLKALSANGTILWSIPMATAIDAYAAINNGVVYEGMDDAVDAISLQSGAILTQFPGAAYFNAGPVVVPSGLYVADHQGFVYAYSLPQAGSATSKPKR